MEPVLDPPATSVTLGQPTVSKSAASWSAIIAGAFVAVAVSLVLFALGSGLGFASVPLWRDRGASMAPFAVTTAIWFVVTQWLSSAAGGYIVGRLRTRWIGTNPHEVFFRDTAHGFVTWAVATVLVATLVVSSIASALGGGVHAAAGVAAAASQGNGTSLGASYEYVLDRLFRRATAAMAQPGPDPRTEVEHVITEAFSTTGSVSDADRAYLVGLISARTGVSSEEAQKRLNDLITTANEAKGRMEAAAEAARKAAAKAAISTALAMSIGAFIACLAAALGGRLRDEHP